MKMQNAEIEFVSFDAQDVIATSNGGGGGGGALTAYFQVTGGLHKFGDYEGSGIWSKEDCPQKLIVNNNSPQDNFWYVLTQGVSSFDGDVGNNWDYGYDLNVYNATNNGSSMPNSGEKLDSLDGIIGWLTRYGNQ